MRTEFKVDVAVVGGGPAGLAAAISAYQQGASVLILERDNILGGILNQCIHQGFGLHYFKEELSGPEYAARFSREIEKIMLAEKECASENRCEPRMRVMLNTMVLSVRKEHSITAVSREHGLIAVKAGAVVLAMGCRERTRGAINIVGTRPAGVFTAGCAQRLVNLEGKLVGKRVVILGSGDIGLIMARRLTFEGAKVLAVAEVMPYSSGLSRNIVQCLDDYEIPLHFSTTVTKIEGKDRVEAVVLSKVDADRKPISGSEQRIECDTLLLSVGLIPENELATPLGVEMDTVTGGARVDDNCQTSVEGFFACGNALHVHDLVDNVSVEGMLAGKSAAEFALEGKVEVRTFNTRAEGLARYVLPQRIGEDAGEVKLFFRVGQPVQNPTCIVSTGDKILKKFRRQIMLPGEMESVTVDLSGLTEDVTVNVEG